MQDNEENEAGRNEEAQRRIPVYVDPDEPEIQDPARQQEPTVWMGANQIAFKLLRCVEAVRDLTRILESIARVDAPLSDRRQVKMLATPLYTLALGVQNMFNELEGNAREYPTLSSTQRQELHGRAVRFAEQVPLGKDSDLRAVRNKIDAHVDRDAVIAPDKYWGKVDLFAYLHWMRVCLEEILQLLKLDVYGWARESGHPDIWSLMAVDGTLVDWCMQDDKPVSILRVTLAKSPKYNIASEIENLVTLHNRIMSKCQQDAG